MEAPAVLLPQSIGRSRANHAHSVGARKARALERHHLTTGTFGLILGRFHSNTVPQNSINQQWLG
jgi:hypothetical protein